MKYDDILRKKINEAYEENIGVDGLGKDIFDNINRQVLDTITSYIKKEKRLL